MIGSMPVVDLTHSWGSNTLMSDAERSRLGIVPLPGDQEAAVEAVGADATARTWFADDLVTTMLAVRRSERAQLGGATPEEACRRHAAVI